MQISLSRSTTRTLALLGAATVVASLFASAAPAATTDQVTIRPLASTAARFTTAFASPLGIEGLTGDRAGNLYVAGRGGNPCPVWKVPAGGGAAVVIGNVPAPCSPAGTAFDASGALYVADGDEVLRFTPDAASPPTATVFVGGVPGANGIAFDRRGDLWVSDGGTGQGRVWRVGPDGMAREAFRVQPMVNEVNLVNGVGGIGRDPRSLPPGTVTVTPNGRAAADTAGSQHIVANGLAFGGDGTLFIADTARGAIWRVTFDRRGNLTSPVGCDTTFAPNTLCLDDILAAHPFLEGADGIALDRADNVWAVSNERNAVVAVTPRGRVVEIFRNAADPTTRLRNGGPLEFPTSPFIAGRTLCTTSSDGNRRDNSPNTAGEVGPGLAGLGKISCLATPLAIPGAPLPVR